MNEPVRHAEGKTLSVRGAENRTGGIQVDSNSQARIGADSQRDGDFDWRIGRTDREAKAIIIVGGILAQLIEQTRNQLGHAERLVEKDQECIEWYEQEKIVHQKDVRDIRKRLENLEALQQLTESDSE